MLVAMVCAGSITARAADPAQAQRALELTRQMVAAIDGVKQYQVMFSKEQRIDGEMSPVETILLRHRREPECRYLRWVENPHKGRELLYCPSKYEGKVKVHEGGLFGMITLTLATDSDRIRKGNLRPIEDSGIYFMSERAKADLKDPSLMANDPGLKIDTETVHGQPSICVYNTRIAPGKDPYTLGAHRICIDNSTHLPTKATVWNARNQKMEEYIYWDYKVNPDWGEEVFDVDNGEYGF
jgi:hypothetical protein